MTSRQAAHEAAPQAQTEARTPAAHGSPADAAGGPPQAGADAQRTRGVQDSGGAGRIGARLGIAALLQAPAIALAAWGVPPWAGWVAAIWGAGVLIAATDSGWRWLNRLLVLLAAGWLLYALAG